MNNDIEKTLSQFKLKPPSENYFKKASNILKTKDVPVPLFNWNYLLAFGLMLSVAFNWYQYQQPKITIAPESLVANNSSAQKSQGGYSVIQGAMVPYGGMRDLTIKLEN